jgi:hypothetical protein
MQTPATEGDTKSKHTLYCSFCGKSQHEVRRLVAGPTVFICNECIELCLDLVREEKVPTSPTLFSMHLLSIQEWAILPTDLLLLQKAVEDGDIPFVIENFKNKFETATSNLENFAVVEPSLRREAGIRALVIHLLLVLQCAGFLGIEPKEISDEITAWASKDANAEVRKAWGQLLGTYNEDLERRGTPNTL